jgi:glycosyltransferase involved in cell wall biosynthesis
MLEFMSCGRPVILGVNGQAREILEASQGGIYVDPENPPQLCEAILTLRNQPSLRESMGRNGRKYIVQNLSRERTAADYLDLLLKLTEAQDSSGRAAAA